MVVVPAVAVAVELFLIPPILLLVELKLLLLAMEEPEKQIMEAVRLAIMGKILFLMTKQLLAAVEPATKEQAQQDKMAVAAVVVDNGTAVLQMEAQPQQDKVTMEVEMAARLLRLIRQEAAEVLVQQEVMLRVEVLPVTEELAYQTVFLARLLIMVEAVAVEYIRQVPRVPEVLEEAEQEATVLMELMEQQIQAVEAEEVIARAQVEMEALE